MATIRDVSKLAGVSVATVSRVINKNGYVHQATLDKVEQAMTALQYTPNQIARSLAGKRTSTVALIVPDILNPFFPLLARAIEDTAQKKGFSVLLCNSDSKQQKELDYLSLLLTKQIDGILLASYTSKPEEIIQYEAKSAIPVVLVDTCFPDYPIASFLSNHKLGARMAVNHLIERGCGKIGHICGPTHIFAARERCLGYEESCRDQSWYTPSLIVSGDFQVDGGRRAIQELLSRHPDVHGVFVGNDLMAIGALKQLHAMDIRVPERLKLIGFDGIATDFLMPELSTIVQPFYDIGAHAMNHLLSRIDGESMHNTIFEFDSLVLHKGQTT
jgi:LacI family transcriptional regulator